MKTLFLNLDAEPSSNYELVDSGQGEKLERIGNITIRRPSSLAIWKKAADTLVWKNADYTYTPDKGWKGTENHTPPLLKIGHVKLEISFLRNGQIGFFPEHSSYLQILDDLYSHYSQNDSTAQALNLFGYTGLFSLHALHLGYQVTHIDLNQPALQTLKSNVKHSDLENRSIRIFKEEALSYLERLARKKAPFHIIAMDPPNFSRFGNSKSWELDKILLRMIELASELVLAQRGTLLFTSHHPAMTKEIIANLMQDYFPNDYTFALHGLSLKDNYGRIIPHGGLTAAIPDEAISTILGD